jgi:sugar lactone lactonase YvrE
MKRPLVAEVVVDCRSLLGEGVTWDVDTATLLWVDVDQRQFHRLDAQGHHDCTQLARAASVVVPRVGGGYVAVIGLDVVTMGEGGEIDSGIASLPPDGDGIANDGRCDPQGRLWVGTVDRSGARRGQLIRVDASGETVAVLSDRALSNGIDWSPNGQRCYHADSMLRRIDELSLDARGDVIDVREFARFSAMPDGLSVDEEGGVWVALWDGGVVQRFTSDGRLDRTVSVPGGWITNCAFGGPELRTLYITTARADLDPDVQRRQPHAGSLFAVEVDVAGRGYTPFGTTPPF